MYHLMVFFTQRYEVVLMIFMEVVDVSSILGVLLFGDVVDIFDIFVTQSTFGQVEGFVVFAALLSAEFFDLTARVVEALSYLLCRFEELLVHVQRLCELQPVEAITLSQLQHTVVDERVTGFVILDAKVQEYQVFDVLKLRDLSKLMQVGGEDKR